MASFAREVDVIAGAIEALHQAHDANDLTRWHEARATVDRLVAAADHGLEKATARAGDAASDATTQLATARQTLARSKADVRELSDHPPTGYKPIAREAELLAAVTHRPEGSTKAAMEAKERAIRAELAVLSPLESRVLAARLNKRVPEDKLAAAFASPANLGNDRRARLVAFIGDARRREALRGAATRPSPARERPGTPPLVESFEQAVAAVAVAEVPQVSRAPAATPASPAHAGALEYLRIYARDTWQGIAAHLRKVVWPQPADRLALLDEPAFTKAVGTILQNWVSGTAGFDRDALVAMAYPEDPLALVATLAAPLHEPFPSALGMALGQLFHRAIAGGLRRMGPRYLEAAEALGADGVVASDRLATTSPIDRVVARALSVPDMVAITMASPGKPRAVRGRRKITLAWQGPRDPTQWNCARAEPADATPEEVAAYLRETYGGGLETTFFAAGLASAAPLFVLPSSWAMKVPEAATHAPFRAAEVPALRDDPPEARLAKLATSRDADAIALAQTPRAKRARAVTPAQLDGVLADCTIQLDDIALGLTGWGLAEEVVEARAVVVRKQADLAHASPDELAAWAPVGTGQRERLARISGAVRKVRAAATMQLTDLRGHAAEPLRGVLRIYATAAASATLATTCETLIAAARTAEAELVARALAGSAVDLEAAREQSYAACMSHSTAVVQDDGHITTIDAGAGIQTVLKRAGNVSADASVLENDLVNGAVADPAAIERVQVEAGEIALDARLRGLYVQLVELKASAADAGEGLFASIAALGSSEFRSLAELTSTIEGELDAVSATREKAVVASPTDDPSTDLVTRRAALSAAQARFEAIGKDRKLVSFFRNANDLVREQRFRTACVDAAIMLGITLLTDGAAGLVTEAVGGMVMGARGVEALSELSLTAQRGIKASGFLVEVAGNTAGQMARSGDSFAKAGLENLVMTAGTTALLGTLGRDAAAAKQLEQTFARDTAAFASLDAKLSTGWYRAGRAVTWTAKESLAITGHVILGAAMGYAAGRVTAALGLEGKPGQPSADTTPAALRELLLQGASIAVGKHVHAALGERMPSYDRLARRGEAKVARTLLFEAQRLQVRAAEVARSANAMAALEVYNDRTRILELELAALDEAERLGETSPHGHADAGPNVAERQAMRRELGEQLANTRTDTAFAVRFTLLGLEELVPGVVWRGTPEQARLAAHEARQAGKVVSEEHDAARSRTVLTVDGRTFEIVERAEPGATTSHAGAPDQRPEQRDEVKSLGLQLANTAGGTRYAGDGLFHIAIDGGVVTVDIQRTGASEATIARTASHVVVKIPKGLSGIELERAVVHQLTKVRQQELRRVAGKKVNVPSDLGPKGKGKALSPDDHGKIAELRVLRLHERDAIEAGELGTDEALRVGGQIAKLEAELGIAGDAKDATTRRHVVEIQAEVQDDAARRHATKRDLDGERGHAGVDLHTHFTGVVGSEVFRNRAAVARKGADNRSWVPLLEQIAEMNGDMFRHGTDGRKITRRATSGDATEIARRELDDIRELRKRIKESKVPEQQAAIDYGIELMARDAVEKALTSTPTTDYNSAYEIRDQLIKDTFGSKAAEGETKTAQQQRAYDDYIREAVLQLVHDGVTYSEQSAGLKKSGGFLNPEHVARVIDQMVAEGTLQPGQIDLRVLGMTVTNYFGERDAHLPPVGEPPKRMIGETDEAFQARIKKESAAKRAATIDVDVGRALDQMATKGVTGFDIGAPELFTFDQLGKNKLKQIYLRMSQWAEQHGTTVVFRPHVGEGSIDTLEGKPFHTDKDRIVEPSGKLSHYERANRNIETWIEAMEEIKAEGAVQMDGQPAPTPVQLDSTKVALRFGHVTHADPYQTARLAALGVTVELNQTSNAATGSISQTEGVHGPRSLTPKFEDHSLPTMLFYGSEAVLSTDGGAVMGTSLGQEYATAHQAIEEVLSGDRTVRVRAQDAWIEKESYRGQRVPGTDPPEYALSIYDMSPNERARFTHGYETLYENAERYYLRRPQPPGASIVHNDKLPFGGAHHLDAAVAAELIPSMTSGVYEGVRANVERAVQIYRGASYTVGVQQLSGGVLVATVQSPDGHFEVVLRSWPDAPSYIPRHDPGDTRQFGSKDAARDWYHDRIADFAALDDAWKAQGLPLPERARRAFEMRHNARLGTREQQPKTTVLEYEVRDAGKYGDPDGPTFDQLVAKLTAKGKTLDQAYEAIIASSRRSDPGYDERAQAQKDRRR